MQGSSRPNGIRAIDLTPAAIGPLTVPTVNLHDNPDAENVNMITCGGQATIPIIHAVSQIYEVEYAEIVATISSKSAGPATRANIDEFIATTSRAIDVRRNAFSARLREALLNALLVAEADASGRRFGCAGRGRPFAAAGTWTSSARRRTSWPPTWSGCRARRGGSSAGCAEGDGFRARRVHRGRHGDGRVRGHGRRRARRLLRAARGPDGPGPGRRGLGQRAAADRPVARGVADAHRGPAPGGDGPALGARRRDPLEGPQPREDLAQQVLVGHASARRCHHLDQVLLQQVIEQDADHANRQPDDRGELRHADGDAAQVENPAAFRAGRGGVRLPGAADDEIDQVEAPGAPRPGPAAGHGVRAGNRPRLRVHPCIVLVAHGALTAGRRSCAAPRA